MVRVLRKVKTNPGGESRWEDVARPTKARKGILLVDARRNERGEADETAARELYLWIKNTQGQVDRNLFGAADRNLRAVEMESRRMREQLIALQRAIRSD